MITGIVSITYDEDDNPSPERTTNARDRLVSWLCAEDSELSAQWQDYQAVRAHNESSTD